MRILLADDNQFVRRGIAGILAQQEGLVVCGEALNSQGVPAPPALVRPEHRIEDLFHRPRAALRKKRKTDTRLLARFLAA